MENTNKTEKVYKDIESESEDEFLNYEKTWTSEELEKEIDELQNHPLFMTDPEQLKNTNNPEVEALRALVYDEEPEVLIQQFYNQGNKFLKEKILCKEPKEDEQNYYLRHSLAKYLEALKLKVDDKELISKIHCNACFCQIRLRNFGKAIKHANSAIELNPKYTKAYYRKSKALLSLKKYQKCIDSCNKALTLSKEKIILKIKQEAEEKLKQ